jgi:probable HAF family extracellular repeat protein
MIANFPALTALSLLLVCSSALADVRYSVTDLGDLGQHYADPYGVNDQAQVVGQSFTARGEPRGFLWSASTGMLDLIPPGQAGTRPEGVAYGINNAGQAVGYARADQYAPALAFAWSASGGFRTIGTLGGNESHARAINSTGQVVGESITAQGADHAFLWNPETGMQDLGAIANFSQAYGINNQGQVVGWTGTPAGFDRAFVWTASTGMVPLGTLGGRHSYAYDINNKGQLVGEAYTADLGGNEVSHACLWNQVGGAIDLGTLGGMQSVAYDINDSGWVVGNAYDSAGINQPFVYDGVSMRNLNDFIDPASGWRLSLANAINNLGQIVVLGTNNAQPWGHALLLSPIPEPAAAGSPIVISAIAIATRRRR